MPPATPLERQWLSQWQTAATALRDVRTRELAALTDDEALAASDTLLALSDQCPYPPERGGWSGLIEMQRLFNSQRSR